MTTNDFKARIAAIMRAQNPAQNGAYDAPQLDAATIMHDLQNNISRPAHDVRGPKPPTKETK